MQFLKGNILSFWYWLTYRLTMWKLGVSEEYIRTAFSALTELDLDELRQVPGTYLFLKAWGNEVHIKKVHYPTINMKGEPVTVYECVIKEGIGHCIYVDEWREETREVILEYGSKHETHWWEVYRSGKWIKSTKFLEYLKILYGGGKYAVPQQESAKVDLCPSSSNG